MSNSHHADGSKTAKSNRSILWLLLGLTFLSWCVYLAGLALVQDQCYDSDGALAGVQSQFQSVNIIPYPNQCGHQFAFQWWIFFLELFVLLLVLLNLTGLARANYWPATWFFLAIVTTLLYFELNNWLGVWRNGALTNAFHLGRVRTVLSGLFLLSILNSLMALFLPGHGEDSRRGKGLGADREAAGEIHGKPYTTAGRNVEATAV